MPIAAITRMNNSIKSNMFLSLVVEERGGAVVVVVVSGRGKGLVITAGVPKIKGPDAGPDVGIVTVPPLTPTLPVIVPVNHGGTLLPELDTTPISFMGDVI